MELHRAVFALFPLYLADLSTQLNSLIELFDDALLDEARHSEGTQTADQLSYVNPNEPIVGL